MRRFFTASTQRAGKGRKDRALRAVVEAMEPRTLFASTPPTPTGPPKDVSFDSFPLSANDGFIEGEVFLDANLNHIADANDVPLPGSEVFIDAVIGNTLNEEIATTDAAGLYELEVPPGTYTVQAFALDPSLQLDLLSTGIAPVTVGIQQTVTGKDFAFVPPASIAGNVFGDVNGNGTLDAGEAGLPNRTVFADLNNNGILDGGEPSAATESSGNYTLGLPSPGTFTIRIEVPPGSTATTPVGGSQQITAAPSVQSAGPVFGLNGPDLSAQIAKPPPVAAVGGQKQKPMQVLVTNVGHSTIESLVGVSLFASTDTVLDPADPQVGALLGKKLKLVPGKSKVLKVPFTVPVAVPSGDYHLLAEVLTAAVDENATNDVAAAAATTTVTQPVVNLGVSYAAQPLPHFNYGAGGFVVVTVTNSGNFEFNGMATFQLFESPDQTLDSADSLLARKQLHVRLRAHQSRAFVVSFGSTGLNKGMAYLITTVDPAAPLSDIDQSNNTVVSTNQTLFL